ncbi:MAG: hypothetical protein CTY25_01365 [Methylobacterium sp.]|nr:MAG: hypothetical protein CTY25_01365 [Methylobacterium sp.]
MLAAAAMRTFGRARNGGVAVTFALLLPFMLGGIGLAIDYAAIARQQAALRSAADSAALNAARELIIAEPTTERVQVVAKRTVDAILSERGKAIDWTVKAQVLDADRGVHVRVSRPITPTFSKLYAFLGFTPEPWIGEREAKAVLSHSSKLCLLLTNELHTALKLQNKARLAGKQCAIHANSRAREGIVLGQSSRITADLLCSRGGIQNDGSTLNTTLLTDCPPVTDPLRNRLPPPAGPCPTSERKVYSSGTITLSPGTYCGGIEAKGTARLELSPGTYVFVNGDLSVRADAEIRGRHVGLYFLGTSSYFRFADNALVDLTGPRDGPMAGILLWRDRSNSLADIAAGLPTSQTNRITANRAIRLTGTIYLPEGQLYIGANAPVAQVSDYTVILARRLELFDGPTLVLNTNYAGSDVPVPQDLGPIGLKNLRLAN